MAKKNRKREKPYSVPLNEDYQEVGLKYEKVSPVARKRVYPVEKSDKKAKVPQKTSKKAPEKK